jgi:hypothetical protein
MYFYVQGFELKIENDVFLKLLFGKNLQYSVRL